MNETWSQTFPAGADICSQPGLTPDSAMSSPTPTPAKLLGQRGQAFHTRGGC